MSSTFLQRMFYPLTKSKQKPVERTPTYKIVVVLDESGSMNTIKNEIKNSLNDLIREQKQVEGRPATFTLVKFNDRVNRVIQNTPIKFVRELNEYDYQPNGTTALYDAIGDTIEWFRNEKDILMVIVTDGMENASKTFRRQRVMDMIKEKEKEYGWNYVYLSNDLKTEEQGDSIGLACSDYSANCCVSQSNYGGFLSNNLNSAISNHRRGGASVQRQLNQQFQKDWSAY